MKCVRVVDKEDKGGSQQAQADETKQKSDGALAPAGGLPEEGRCPGCFRRATSLLDAPRLPRRFLHTARDKSWAIGSLEFGATASANVVRPRIDGHAAVPRLPSEKTAEIVPKPATAPAADLTDQEALFFAADQGQPGKLEVVATRAMTRSPTPDLSL